jgi:hypothetical protein
MLSSTGVGVEIDNPTGPVAKLGKPTVEIVLN